MHSYRKSRFIAIPLLLALLVSCRERSAGSGTTIPFVEKFLADTTAPGWHLVRDYSPSESRGCIAVLGDLEGASLLSDRLLTSDRFNNIDGKALPDGLPDFAGESLSLLADLSATPYDGYLKAGNAAYLRELTVKEFLMARDTACMRSPYEHEQLLSKLPAKVVVLSSPYMAAFGQADIDTLCKASGCRIPVISAAQASLRAAVSRHEGKAVGVWTTEDVVEAGLYPAVLERMAPETSLAVFSSDSLPSSAARFEGFMQKYLSSGPTKPLGAIILDDTYPDAALVRSAVAGLLSSTDEALAPLRALLDEDVELILPWEAVADECFRAMRKANNFTHRVAFPDIQAYITVAAVQLPPSSYNDDGSLTDDFKYNRAPDSSLESFSLLRMSDRYLPEGALNFLETQAHNVFSLYVQ